MSSNLSRTPFNLENLYLAGLRAPTAESSPQSTMANTQESDPNAQPQKMTLALLTKSISPTSFLLANRELLETGKYADAKIIANGKTYNVHKNVLCTRSIWFRKALEGAFRDARESVVEISAPDNIERVLEFLYTGAVDLASDNDLMTAANELSVLGDFYLSDEMNTYATQVLGQYLGEFLNSICDVELLPTVPAEYATREYWTSIRRPLYETGGPRRQHNFRFLNEKGFIERLCVAIRSAYAKPSGIYGVYVDFVYAARFHCFGNPSIQALRDEIPDFGYDILSAFMTGPLSSAFKGNKAFEQWKDGLASPETITRVKHPQSREDRESYRNERVMGRSSSGANRRGRDDGWDP